MLHDLAKLPHLTISIKLVDRRRKHHSQANHLVRPNQSSAYMPISGLDTRGVTPELKLRLKFYCSWTWWVFLLLFFSCWLCLFVCFIVSFLFLFLFSFFLSILSTLPSPSSNCSCYLLYAPSFSCAKIHCSPAQLLFLPLLTHSFPLPPPSPPINPKPVTRLHLPSTHSPPANQPTVPTLHNHNPLQSLTQEPTLQQ
jgi:hypothetical protein